MFAVPSPPPPPSHHHLILVFSSDRTAIVDLHKDIIDLYPETGLIEQRAQFLNFWGFVVPLDLPPPVDTPGAGMRHDVLIRYLRSAAAAYRFQWAEMDFGTTDPRNIMVDHS